MKLKYDRERILQAVDKIVKKTMQMDMTWDWPCGVAYFGIADAYEKTGNETYLNLLKDRVDELIDLDSDVQEIQAMIEKTSEAVTARIDWTKAWSRKYPILVSYQGEVDVQPYVQGLTALLERLQKEYGYNDLDAFLVLKDILARVWKERKGASRKG